MKMARIRGKYLIACALVIGLAVLGCGGNDLRAPARVEGSNVAVAPATPVLFPPTATAYPTFTPYPTAAPSDRQGSGVGEMDDRLRRPAQMTPTPAGLEKTPVPALVIGDEREVAVPTRAPTPTVSPGVDLYVARVAGTDVSVVDHRAFPFAVAPGTELYDQMSVGAELPVGRRLLYGSNLRYMVYMLELDMREAPVGFRERVYGRWSYVGLVDGRSCLAGLADPSWVMLEETAELTPEVFRSGFVLGREQPGMWGPGCYRVELLDSFRRVLTRWNFEVK